MILRGRQRQFVLLVVTGWTIARTATLADWGGPGPSAPAAPRPLARLLAAAGIAPPPAPASASWPLPPPGEHGRAQPLRLAAATMPMPSSAAAAAADPAVADAGTVSAAARAAPAPEAPLRSAPAQLAAAAAPSSRLAMSAYLFDRPGHGRSLADGGALGGSQVAARITYQLNAGPELRTAAAARIYAPLHAKGAEAAVGLDWHPLPRVPLRLSIERRIALDSAGRDAWSAYAAGGFYAERRGWVLDGYGQAGVVGVKARDLFADGALRAGRLMPIGRSRLTLGTGLWGAAQPGAERVDAGPRAAIAIPVARHSLSASLDGRFRIAGRASPGSGAALTLGVDF